MHTLNIDIEDYSPVPVEYGVYKRAEQGEIILLSYSLDKQPVVCLDLTVDKVPNWFLKALVDPNYKKKAYNAPYERNYFNVSWGIYSPPEQWECSLVRAAMCGLPLSLAGASSALGLEQEKDTEGKKLIRLFCIPDRNGKRTMPCEFPEKWERFKNYNAQDVVVEMAVDDTCQWYKIPEEEHHIWCLTEKMNERGVKVDLSLIRSAMEVDVVYRKELIEEATKISGLANVNSPKQLKDWLLAETGQQVDSLNKIFVRELLGTMEGDAKRILEIRQLLSKTSIKKYSSMLNAAGIDGRVRGMIQYGGANRTLRDAGRICQPQNFPRISDEFSDFIDGARELVRDKDVQSLEMIFPKLSEVLSQLLRTCFMADPGKELIVLDFKNIESLGLAALADETWRIEFFRGSGDIYKKSWSMSFGIPVEEVTKDQRQKGKVSELLFGFSGGVAAMERNNITIEDPKKRIPKKEIPGLVKNWREANPNIVKLWRDLDTAAKEAITTGAVQNLKYGVAFAMKKGNLLMRLPSGRCIVYQKAHFREFYMAYIDVASQDDNGDIVFSVQVFNIGEVKKKNKSEYNFYLERFLNKHNQIIKDKNGLFDGMSVFTPTKKEPQINKIICYWGLGDNKTWSVITTYGGKISENLTQATCRDLLMHAVSNIEAAGYPVILRVHDELVVEVPKGSVTLQEIEDLMLDVPKWARSWPVKADGFVSEYYQK